MIPSTATTNTLVGPAQCLLVANSLYEPISPPSLSVCQDVSTIAPPYSYPALPVYEPISPPLPSDNNNLADAPPSYSSTLPAALYSSKCKELADGRTHILSLTHSLTQSAFT